MPKNEDEIQPIDANFDEVVSAIVGTPKVKKAAQNLLASDRGLPKALAESDELHLGNVTLSCAVLDDANNTRILTQNGFLKAIGRHPFATGGTGGSIEGMAPFLRAKNLEPFISEDLKRSTTAIEYIPRAKMSGVAGVGYGYRASLLADVCWVYHDAMVAGKLLPNQIHIGEACSKLLRALTNLAIDDLVDEATGFKNIKIRRAIEKIIQDYVAPEKQIWVHTFDDELYMNIFRLNGWPYTEESIKKRPGIVGKWTNDFYDRLAPGVRSELHRMVPRDANGRPIAKLHQMLTREIGHPKLKEFLEGLKTLMIISKDWKQFQTLLDIRYPHWDTPPMLPFEEFKRLQTE
ncbi:P63C domain-containing protein [Asticcacaulis sp.]|uniref:P63C domain-containing protein n=1 Tax=Asticcacaulis sp. TaxID=1872648 RepID=UPI00262A5DE2|nr:P63C domain-containing protein [Asticcacaulis sp.]